MHSTRVPHSPALCAVRWVLFAVCGVSSLSGPREDEVELHIRALGDHTGEIVGLAKQRGPAATPTWICIDGPYGCQSFNYRR